MHTVLQGSVIVCRTITSKKLSRREQEMQDRDVRELSKRTAEPRDNGSILSNEQSSQP
jgi:hypothetical protein